MKKITFLFALLCASVMSWADTEKFVPSAASENGTFFAKTSSWEADNTSTGSYNSTTGTITIHIGEEKNAQWKAQYKLNEGFSYVAGKSYDFSIKFHASKGIGGVTIKADDNNGMLFENASITLGADLDYVYTKTDVAGVDGGNGILVFDFGSSPANTDITISEISIIEKEAPAKTSECEGSRGHEGGTPHLDFAISYDGTTTTLTATPKAPGIEFDFFQINVNNSVSDLMGGEATKASVQYTTTAAAGTDLYIAFLYSPTDFGGNYQTTAGFSSSSTAPYIIYYKVGDCAAGGAANPHLTLTNPTKSSVLLPKGEHVTVTYNSENTADATIESSAACASVSGNVVTAESTGTATITVSQAEVTDTWQEASVSFEVNAFDWNDISFISGSLYKMKASSSNVDIRNIQPHNAHSCIYVTLPDAVGLGCSLEGNYEIEGAGIFIYTDAFVTRQTPFTISWKGNTYDCYVFYDLDETAPVISGVTVTSYTHESAVITITANEAFVSAEVFNNGVSMGIFTPAEGAITLTGLMASTTYDQLTVKVKDAAGNASAAADVPDFTTAETPSITPVTFNGYASNDGFYIKYAITRNSSQALVFTIQREYLPKEGVVNPQLWINNTNYGQMTTDGDYYTKTMAGPYTDNDELNVGFRTEFAGGATSVAITYTVGSEQAAPASIPVGAVVLNKESNTLSVGETDNLTATVYPSFASAAGTITWASDAPAYATVDNGTVTAVAAGTANITATCGGVTSAPYVVTVTASLTEAKFYGCGAFANISGKVVSYDYVFTRATNHEVTLDVVFSRSMSGIVGNDNFMIYINGVNQHMTYTEATLTATYDFGAQTEGASFNYYFYFPLEGGGLHQIPQTAYVVGSSNDAVHAFAIGENENNVDALAAADGQTFNKVFVNRSFDADNLYTLVLPFNADASVLPGSLTKLNNSYYKDNGDLYVNFVDAEAIEAGVPYLYTPSENVVNPVFENVTISKDLNPTISDAKAKYYGIYAPTTGADLKLITNAYVLGNDKYLYAVTGLEDNQQMKALRGYFVLDFQSSVPGAPMRKAQVVFNEVQSPTGIESVQTSSVSVQKMMQDGQIYIIRDGKMYNAQGQLVK